MLYLCGANRQGILPVVEDAEMLFGEPVVFGYKKGNRLVKFQKKPIEISRTGWWQIPGIAPVHLAYIRNPNSFWIIEDKEFTGYLFFRSVWMKALNYC